MQISPLGNDASKAAAGKAPAPAKPAEAPGQALVGDQVQLSTPKAPKALKSAQHGEKQAAPAKSKVSKPEPQAVPTSIAQLSGFESHSPKNQPSLTFKVIKAKEKPFLEIRDVPGGEYKAKRNEFYADIYADPDLQTRAGLLVKDWALGKGMVPTREAYANVLLKGKTPKTDLEKTVSDLLVTRRERWDRLSEKLGIEPPTGFHAYRGVVGDYAADAVVKAWSDDSSKYMKVPNLELSSWSLDHNAAKDFASGTEEPSVVYEADIPFSRTLLDKWVDDDFFIKAYYKEEEVVVAASKDSIRIPKDQATVKYNHKVYTYADRAELIKAWNQRPVSGPQKIFQAISDQVQDLKQKIFGEE